MNCTRTPPGTHSIPFHLPYHPRVALAARLIIGLGTTLACAPSGCMHTDHCNRGCMLPLGTRPPKLRKQSGAASREKNRSANERAHAYLREHTCRGYTQMNIRHLIRTTYVHQVTVLTHSTNKHRALRLVVQAACAQSQRGES